MKTRAQLAALRRISGRASSARLGLGDPEEEVRSPRRSEHRPGYSAPAYAGPRTWGNVPRERDVRPWAAKAGKAGEAITKDQVPGSHTLPQRNRPAWPAPERRKPMDPSTIAAYGRGPDKSVGDWSRERPFPPRAPLRPSEEPAASPLHAVGPRAAVDEEDELYRRAMGSREGWTLT